MTDKLARPEVKELITFFYYEDVDRAACFYQEIMGFELAIDQGFAKIFRVAQNAYLGVVDEKKGAQRAHPQKPVELTVIVSDPDAWYAYLLARGMQPLSAPRTLEALNLRMFLLHDPEGYLIEIQKFL
jgi:catechol 2,3-dioxygenase-like lactoylglutathione lyase family enzyme